MRKAEKKRYAIRQESSENSKLQDGLCASFTVEAAMLMPVVILLLAWTIGLTVNLHQKTAEAAENIQEVRELDSVKTFRELSLLEKMMQD